HDLRPQPRWHQPRHRGVHSRGRLRSGSQRPPRNPARAGPHARLKGNTMRFFSALALLALASPAWAALDADAMKRWGGTYLADCKNPNGPKVTIFENDVVFLNGSNRVAGANLQASYSYYGNSPPEGFVVALLSETAAGLELLAIVY